MQMALGAIEDMELYSLTMEYAPSSTMHGFTSFELVPDGANVTVNNDNVHEYVKLMYRFMLEEGVRAQMDAIREGISEVFPASQLRAFTPLELRSMLSGEASVNWTKEELVEHLEPRNGYDAESPTFLHLVQVLAEMGENDRKDFLRFATGVRVLPPGGLKNLEPKLTVVRKHCDTDPNAHFPSANTCFHFLKLPEYSSQEILLARLRTALQHGMDGFFFH
jgi:E3 ubiquitin-protein ligase HECTD1